MLADRHRRLAAALGAGLAIAFLAGSTVHDGHPHGPMPTDLGCLACKIARGTDLPPSAPVPAIVVEPVATVPIAALPVATPPELFTGSPRGPPTS